MKVIFPSTSDDNGASGGVKQAYRHIDILNENGIEAYFAHPTRGFRYTWFQNNTKTICSEDVVLEPDDYLLLSEVVQEIPKLKGAERCKKVILVQNPFNVFTGFGRNLDLIQSVYTNVNAVLCQSKYTEDKVRHFFPDADVYGYRYSFDRPPFGYCGEKERIVSYMPRKVGQMANAIVTTAWMGVWPKGWAIRNLDGVSESEVADALKKSAVFMSFCVNEGFGMPPAEAMACGCVVVGWPGYAGTEFMKPELCFPVADMDYLSMAQALSLVVKMDLNELVAMGKKASDFVLAEYSAEKEVTGIMAAWNQITRSRVEIQDEVKKPWQYRVKAVIMHHNIPDNADKLYEALAPVFDDVEIFDNGSDPDKVPIHVSRSRPNVYWTGTWNEVMATCSDYDAVWVLGCDVQLKDNPEDYRRAIEDSLPFGCWTPCVAGRSRPFMWPKNYDGKPRSVRVIEGVAMAASGKLMKEIKQLPEGSPIGFGQDLWMCYRSRKMGTKNVIDGRVQVWHPPHIGYNAEEAGRQMQTMLPRMLGPDYKNIIEYTDFFVENVLDVGKDEDGKVVGEEKNIMSDKLTIVMVDNGWGLADFLHITDKMVGVRRLVMMKGATEGVSVPGCDVVSYDPEMKVILREADVAFFPRVGTANKEEYIQIVNAGIPMVVKESCSQGIIEHEKNGYFYRDDLWAMHWLAMLKDHPEERTRIEKRRNRNREAGVPNTELSLVTDVKQDSAELLVSVITPTYHRDPVVLRRCVCCMLLQTTTSWEQLVCSDGGEEESAKKLVEGFSDPRIKYRFLSTPKKDGDYGNTVRSEMLKEAKGKYVLFCDDDNIILPEYLEKMAHAIENSGTDFAVCRVIHFGPLNEIEVGKPPKVLSGDPVKLYHIDPLQILVKREAILKVGWDTTVGYLSDGVTLENLGKAFKHVRLNDVLGVHT